jgi:outer membrane protein OmpA-like peptidoglycan-associated protein
MSEADNVRQSSSGQTAATLAPEAFAHAEKIRHDAELAYQNGDLTGAQILAERAVAAYQHALVLGRIAYATETANRARVTLRASEQALAQNDGEQKRVSAQADDLEVRIKVIKDANPVVSAGPADAGRESARLSSSRSLALDARLLCAAARMLGPDTPPLSQAQAAVDDLDKRLTTQSRAPAPIESAMRARAQCLAALTAARRPAGTTSTLGKSDQLLSELSAMGGLSPVRDDRGVVVTLRNLFAQNQLTQDARDQLASLGRVAQAHPEFPVQVVVHAAGPRGKGPGGKDSAASDQQRGDAVAKALVDAGAGSERIRVEPAGSAHPVIDPAIARDPIRNDRIEIIFVDPGG